MSILDEILNAIKVHMSVTWDGEHIVEFLDGSDNVMILEIDGEQYLIQKR